MKLRPLGDYVLVRCIAPEGVTPGGILLPDQAQEKPQRGKVLAIGAGLRNKDGGRDALEVSVGQVILFARYGGHSLEGKTSLARDKDLMLLRESDILGVVEDE